MMSPSAPSRVIKMADFHGRPLYVYLPPGYDDKPARRYPVLYMHDGQNCFEAYVQDSFVGSWRADETADALIQQGLVRPFIIVGVSHGQNRIAEYLPPDVTFHPKPGLEDTDERKGINGRAHETFAFYRNDVAPYIRQKFRILDGRENIATCGSSLGGVFSTFIAWEHPEFARHHAIVSPAYWALRNGQGVIEMIERLRTSKPRDVRLWLDSGTQDEPGRGDDGLWETIAARNALLTNGYVLGSDFRYFLAEGAIHRESAWAARLPQIFQFLFPAE